MYAVATFLIVAVITSVFSLMATGALIATGVPPEIASFQARSALTGSGFTTTEAENVVNHPARRRIVSTTMFVGNLGTPTLVVSVLIGLLAPGPGSTAERSLVATSGVLIILLLIGNRPVKRAMVRLGQHYARRRLLPALVVGPEQLLSLGRDFSVTAVRVAETPKDRSWRGPSPKRRSSACAAAPSTSASHRWTLRSRRVTSWWSTLATTGSGLWELQPATVHHRRDPTDQE